jgi:hypothetical protein
MRRSIGLLVTLVLSLLAVPLAAAQPQAALPRIGYLGDMPELFTDAFRQGLRELGYIEGQNLAVEYRWAEGQADRLRDLAADLAQLKMDVLVTAGRPRAVRPSTPPARSPLSWRTWAIPWGCGTIATTADPKGQAPPRSWRLSPAYQSLTGPRSPSTLMPTIALDGGQGMEASETKPTSRRAHFWARLSDPDKRPRC